MIQQHKLLNITLTFICSAFILACSRAENEKLDVSSISIAFGNSAMSMLSLPAGKKACFGVNVTASDITNRPGTGTCGPAIGNAFGFVAENETLSIEVNKGTNRTFQIFAYVLDDASPCPTVDQVLASSGGGASTYIVGTATGVNLSKEAETVAVTINFPGIEHSVYADYNMLSCGNSGSLHATLDSSGNISNGDAASTLIQALAIVESFWTTLTNAVSSVTSSNLFTAVDINVSPEVFSLTMKPDTQKLYGLLQGGQIVEINTANGSYSVPLSCPFSASNCEVPAWMQSISAGTGSDLFALDHSGNIYRIDGSSVTDLSVKVGAHIQQVSFF